MKLTLDQVKKVAKLANLPLTPDEEEKYSEQLSKILDYVNQLEKADTKGVESTFNVVPQFNVFQKDNTSPSLSLDETLSNASSKEDKFFVTKGVFNSE